MMQAITQTMIFLGIMTGTAYATTIGALTIIEKSMNIKDDKETEKDYVYLNDGTEVEFNEEDQE